MLPLSIASVVAVAVAVAGLAAFDRARAAIPLRGRSASALPGRGIWLFGFVILAAFTVDAAVSTWSTVYLQDELLVTAALAPLGYAAYQGAILLTRLLTDRAAGPVRPHAGSAPRHGARRSSDASSWPCCRSRPRRWSASPSPE